MNEEHSLRRLPQIPHITAGGSLQPREYPRNFTTRMRELPVPRKEKSTSTNMKLFIFTIFLVILLTSCYTERYTSCEGENETQNIYSMKYEEAHENAKIIISYPQLKNFEGGEIINAVIYKETMKLLNYYSHVESLILELDYEIGLFNDEIISIVYRGFGHVNQTMRVNRLFFTLNINIQTGERIKLSDTIHIDESFIDFFKSVINSEKVAVLDVVSDFNPEQKQHVIRHVSEMDCEILLNKFIHGDTFDNFETRENSTEMFAYFTSDGIGISVSTLHVLGGYVNFEISYKDMELFGG